MTTPAQDLIQRLQSAVGPRIRIERELGGGGMAHVFLAADLAMPRALVVKMLPPEQAPVLHAELFRREIQIAASLQHPNIVPVLSAGELDGLPWYTMQFVEGSTLRHRLDAGPIPVAEAIRLLRDLARAVAYAHRRDIVHRDLKPENILISDGVPMVTDFGVAKALSHTHTLAQGTSATSGIAFGTPPYMAPEQMAADPAMDHRMDIYALGMIAFEVFSGARPFTGSPQELLLAKMTTPPPDLAVRCPDVPPPLAALVLRCLEPDPARRPQSAAEVLEAFEEASSTSYAGMLPLLHEPARIRRAVAQYMVGVAAVGALAWLALRVADVPDWVLPGALGSMALASPLVLVTALTRYAAHRTMAGRAWHPSVLNDITQGGMRALALRLGRALQWKHVLRSTVAAVGAFVLLVTGHAVLRKAGIGAPGTLAAAGIIEPHQLVLVTEFGAAPADSVQARIAADAIRVGLQESRTVNVMSPEEVADALRRMQRPTSERVTLAVARELARREGAPLIIDGDLTRGTKEASLTIRIVEAATGTTRAVFERGVGDDSRLLAVAGRLVRDLRAKLGDSFRDVRASTYLPRVTTASLEALELYARGSTAWYREDNRALALDLFRQAVAIDSGFASAWRSIYFLAGGLRQPDLAREAAAAAFRHRHRAPLPERLLIEGSYYSGNAPEADIAKAIAAYEQMWEVTGRPHNNLAWLLLQRKEYVRAESLYRVVIRNEPDSPGAYNGMFWTLMRLGRYAAADSHAAVARARHPDLPGIRRFSAEFPCALGDERGCIARFDSAVKSHPGLGGVAARARANMAIRHGRLAEARRIMDGQDLTWHARRYFETGIDLWVLGDRDRAARDWEPVFTDRPPPVPSGWMGVATHLAAAGRPDLARRALQRLDAAMPDSLRNVLFDQSLAVPQGEIAFAEGRYAEAIARYRSVETHPIDRRPVDVCQGCVELTVGQAFDRAQQPDSAIHWLEAFLETPHHWAGNEIDHHNLAGVHERLGQLYEARGDRANARRHYGAFVELWREADPVLQPRVQVARERLVRLESLQAREPARSGELGGGSRRQITVPPAVP